MKLLHCADLHLGSAMETSLSPARARERRSELLQAFARLCEYAEKEGVRAVLMAGDVFDTKDVPRRTKEYVRDVMAAHPEIDFILLRGNHDGAVALDLPENAFSPEDGAWMIREYPEDGVCIAAFEAQEGASPIPPELDAARTNIVMLHGEAAESGASVGGHFNRRDFAGRNIDYLALGHYHSFATGYLDDRGVWCYAGCPEGRGFDECGEKGFVLLETGENDLECTFVPFAKRTLHDVTCDLSRADSQHDVERAVLRAVDGIPESDMVRLTLSGHCPPEQPRNLDYLSQMLAARFYCVRLYDETKLALDASQYENDDSVRGEFVRLVMDMPMDETERRRVLTLGLEVLRDGEVSL